MKGKAPLAKELLASLLKALLSGHAQGQGYDTPQFRRADRALHVLWTKAVGSPSYEKEEWKELAQAINHLATGGPKP